MRIVLDTGVFFRPDILEKAMASPADKVLPAVAYAERLRQVALQGPAQMQRFRRLVGYLVEPFQAAHADAFMPATAELTPAAWKRLERDALIAAHVRPGDELWTTDPQDFMELGLPAEQIVAV
jgi:predicted nucleic acid-binding protein